MPVRKKKAFRDAHSENGEVVTREEQSDTIYSVCESFR